MKIRAGSVVIVRPAFGAGEPIEVIVERVDVHKGRKVIDYSGGWAYFCQIDEVVKY